MGEMLSNILLIECCNEVCKLCLKPWTTEFDGASSAVKAARTVRIGGKSGDNIKGLPITIRSKKPGNETVIPK